MVIFAIALFYLKQVFIILLIAIIISSAIHAPITYLERKRIPRFLSTAFIFVVGIGAVVLILYTLMPIALIQLKYFINNINTFKAPALDFLGSGDLIAKITMAANNYINNIISGGSDPASFISSILSNAIFVVICFVLSFYMTLSRDGVERFILSLFPTSIENYAVDLYQRTRIKLSRWLSGQLVMSFIVGSMTFIGLLILGVDYALILGVLAAILELIPFVGPIVVGTLTFLITLPQSFTTAILVVIVFTLIHQIENHVLIPFIMSKALDVDPIVVVIALVAGAELAGLVGIIVSVPVTIILQGIIEDWSERKKQIRAAV